MGHVATLAVRLALSTLGTHVDAARWRAGCRLRGDGAQQVVPLAQEVAVGAQTKAALAQHHAGAGGLCGPGAVVVLQLGQVGCVALRDEL